MWLLTAFSQTRSVNIICGCFQPFFQTRPVIIYGCLQPFLKPKQSFIICVQPFLKADGDQPYVAAYSLFSNPTNHYMLLLTAFSQTRPVIKCGSLQPLLKPDPSLYVAAYSLFSNPTTHYMWLLTAFSKSRPDLLLTTLQNSSPENLRVLLTGLGPILSTTEESREGSGGL